MQWLTLCIFCQHQIYALSDGMLKCSSCKKKYSPERTNKILTLISAFCDDENALSSARRLGLSYVSVQGYYENFRRLCAHACEDEYEQIRQQPCAYEEYFYLERSKRHKKEAIFDAHNFLTFDYDGHLYTLLMPSLQQYKKQFLEDQLDSVYLNEFDRFKRNSRIIKVSKEHDNIVKFWDYFESSILRYKGVTDEAFPLFLKEIEFKFNHGTAKRKSVLENYYFQRRSA